MKKRRRNQRVPRLEKKVVAESNLEVFQKFEKKLQISLVRPNVKGKEIQLKPEKNSVFYFSRYSGLWEMLEYGDEENHFKITMDLIANLHSPAASDRYNAIDKMKEKFSKQSFTDETVRIFLLYMSQFTAVEKKHTEFSLMQRYEIYLFLEDLYFRPAKGFKLLKRHRRVVPVQEVAAQNFSTAKLSPTQILIYFKICGGKHLIAWGDRKQMREAYKTARYLGIEIHRVKKDSIKWSRHVQNNQKHSQNIKLLEQKNIWLQHYRQNDLNFMNLEKTHELIKFIESGVPEQPGIVKGLKKTTLGRWYVNQGFLNQSAFRLGIVSGPVVALVGVVAYPIWLVFSIIETVVPDILIKHDWRKIPAQFREALADIKRKKAVDGVVYSLISAPGLYGAKVFLDENIWKLDYLPLKLVSFMVLALLNGGWQYLQRTIRSYFSIDLSKKDLARGFVGNAPATLYEIFISPMAPMLFTLISKACKAIYSVTMEVRAGKKDKFSERHKNLKNILNDFDNSTLERKLRKEENDFEKKIKKARLKGNHWEQKITQTMVALNLMYLSCVPSRGGEVINDALKKDSNFKEILEDAREWLRDSDRILKILEVITFNKEAHRKLVEFYEKYQSEFIAKHELQN